MALSISTGVQSLVSVGMSVGDIAALYGVGKRFGNWVTAASGDRDFLDLLQEDELDILRRRGVLDLARFNKRWAKKAQLLVNGKPTELVGQDAKKILGELPRFTASMVAIVGALDCFMQYSLLKDVVKRLVKKLLQTTEYGEDVLASQLTDRTNAWRSCAFIRGIIAEGLVLRNRMLSKQQILDGFMPPGDAPEMADFLEWLLAGSEESYSTASSDVAAVAYVLSQTAFDVLTVQPLGGHDQESLLKLKYDPEKSTKVNINRRFENAFGPLLRPQCTTVPLLHPEESLSTYPITTEVANAARQAWDEGRHAARFVRLQAAVVTNEEKISEVDLRYEILDLGKQPRRTRGGLVSLAKQFGFHQNAELYDRLSSVFERESSEVLSWLHDQTALTSSPEHITCHEMNDPARITAFTIYQAFYMGYYYAVFMPLVDTNTLAIQSVHGAWGYRSTEFLDLVRRLAIIQSPTRQSVLTILGALCLSQIVDMPPAGRGQSCIGIAGKRTLLTNSLLGVSDSPETVAGFQLLDVDVGNIPSDIRGLIRPGEADGLDQDFVNDTGRMIKLTTKEADWTKHIEPDWDGNPETMLLVFRHLGRRLFSANPAVADLSVIAGWIRPVEQPAESQSLPNAISCDVNDFLKSKTPWPISEFAAASKRPCKTVVLVHSNGRPNMRYAAVAAHAKFGLALSSNCIVEAAKSRHIVIIA